MDTFYRILVAAHGLVGLVALVTFWLAAFAKKGSPLHLRTGRFYMCAMIGIIVTAVPMAAIIGARGHLQNALFLAYLVVITSTGVWQGWRAVKRKRDQAAFRSGPYAAIAVLNLLAAVTVFVVGQRAGNVLLMGFSAIGAISGVQMLARRARPLVETRWWLREHFSAMIGCGVATHVAFLSIGLGRLIAAAGLQAPSWYGMIAWFAPLALAVVVGIRLDRKYFPKRTAPAVDAARG
jgi:hypothetical protein